MTADQWKRNPNAASVLACSLREQCRAKRKKFGSPNHDLNMRSHISLEWDDNQRRVVSKKEQIGIKWRDLNPFIDSAPRSHNHLADVCVIPQEILELENIREVLSYEVWQTHLSEDDKSFLMQFLPRGLDMQQVVQPLLEGSNFHFGNPFSKWATSLCSGNLHPDVIRDQEQCFRDNKKAYYSDLQNYHNGIIGKLQKWKERWSRCKDPEKDFVEKIWRSRAFMNKNNSSYGNESRFLDPEENHPVTSDSYSWGADEKTCSSDNQNSSIMEGGKHQERKDLIQEKCRNPLAAVDGTKLAATSRKGENLNRRNIQCSDAAKYMSYIKISKKQHQLVKNMKQSGNSIQPRSLSRVLGNLDLFHVHPYAKLEEEEKKKLHERWSQLANIDLPAAFLEWRNGQVQRRHMIKSLGEELERKLKPLMELVGLAEDESPCAMLEEHKIFEAENHETICEDDNKSVHETQNEPLQPVSLINGTHEFNPADMVTEDNDLLFKQDDASHKEVSGYSRNLSPGNVGGSQGVSLTSSEDFWPAINMPHSYYAPADQLPLGRSELIDEQHDHLINLESVMNEEEMRKNMLLHKQSNEVSSNSYFNQDRDELLQSFFKGRDIVPYPHQQHREVGLAPQATPNMLVGTEDCRGHFQEQMQAPLELVQMHNQQNELYIHQNIPQNMLPNGGRHLIPRQEHLPPVNVPDWVINPLPMSAPPQAQVIRGDLSSRNLFSSEHLVHGDLSGLDGSSISRQGAGNGNSEEGSLVNISSCYSDLHSGTLYNMMGSAQQLVSPGNGGVISGHIVRSGNVLQQAANPLDYLNGRESGSPLMSNNTGWMNLPCQNSSVHDSMAKSFLRSWNR